MSRTLRVVLDIEVRPFTTAELKESGADQYGEDCAPTGTDDDLDDAMPIEIAQSISDGLHREVVDEMLGGSGLFVAFENATAVSAEWK